MERGPYKRPARAADAPVTDVEVRAIVRLAEQRWGNGGPRPQGGILVAKYGPTARAESSAVWGRPIEAALLVSHPGTRPLDLAEAEAINKDGRLIEGSIGFYYPRFAFAPLIRTNHLVLSELFDGRMGHGQLIQVSARGGIRGVRLLWIN